MRILGWGAKAPAVLLVLAVAHGFVRFADWLSKGDALVNFFRHLPLWLQFLEHPIAPIALFLAGILWLAYLTRRPVTPPTILDSGGRVPPARKPAVLKTTVVSVVLGLVIAIVIFVVFRRDAISGQISGASQVSPIKQAKQPPPVSPPPLAPRSESSPSSAERPLTSKSTKHRSRPWIFVEGVQIDKKSPEVHLAFKNMRDEPAFSVKETRWIEAGNMGVIWDKTPLGMREVFIKTFDGLKAGGVAVADVGTLAPGEPFVDVWFDESNKYRTKERPIVQNVGTVTYTDYSGKATSELLTYPQRPWETART